MALPMVLALAMTASSAQSPLAADADAWHQKRIERLKAEDGWLTLVGLDWLEEGESVAGSAEGSQVKLPASAPGRLGVLVRKGKEVRFTPEKGVEVTVGGKPFAGGPLRTDVNGDPDVLRTGTVQLVPIVRGDRLAIRVRDAAAEVRKVFHGIERFPVSPAWTKEARFEPAAPGRKVTVPNVLGYAEEVPLAGTAVFTHAGKEYRLVATGEGDSLFFVFGDLTNRKETYGGGRFLYTAWPKDDKVVLDFNRAYNPPCVFTPYATCPLPPKQNKLATRVEAGELRYDGH